MPSGSLCRRKKSGSAKFLAAVAGVSGLALTPAAFASPATFMASSGDLAASVKFETSGNDLVVTLANTSTKDVLVQSNVLCSVYFDVNGTPLSLKPGSGSAKLGPGASVLFGTPGPGNSVGGEWAFKSGISNKTTNHANYGLGAAGYGIFGGYNFPGSNLQGPNSVAGTEFGLTSPFDNPLTGQKAVTGKNALIKSSVVFTLPGLPDKFDPQQQINNVTFQYGTALAPAETALVGFLPLIPEPATMSVLGVGALVFAARRRRS